ncbi:ABC-ATPase domain-containing protein [Actinomyces radicidentis]|uniref:ABC-ATPase domain-containing protein n=1 Tax=Actinomyces radicidentis TaxID=111015 RepID=UPI0026E100EE|nr:ABC-ATPase domain-containing protein [Actinomyces radicidentis]
MSGYDDREPHGSGYSGRDDGRSGGRGYDGARSGSRDGDRGYRGRGGNGGGYRGGRDDRHSGGHGGYGNGYQDRGRRRDYDDEPREGALSDLVGHLHAIDSRSYAAYKAIVGRYEAPEGWALVIDRVQPDPYAPPSRVHLEVPLSVPGLAVLTAGDLLSTRDRRIAVGDFLTRELHAAFRGTALSIASPGQEILERSSVLVVADGDGDGDGDEREAGDDATDARSDGAAASAASLEIRARLALPARGRSIQGREAARIVSLDLPRALDEALDLTGERAERLRAHLAALEDHRALTCAVESNGWVAFLADGSLLPRRSGVSDEPMRSGAVALTAPESLAATVTLPHAGAVRGTVIGAGVTLVVGGGYHGKSTLLTAIERGVYPHVPGDGRELVATAPSAVKVRAADGRAVTGVDLTPFISHLPGGRDTASFTTKNASGSTSQAASIIEAVEAGASALLLDEDTSATNLLIRDARMRELVAAEREPITPLVDRVSALAEDRGVSTVLVMGGSGDYLDVADRVLLMDSYRLEDATERAHEVAAASPREATALTGFGEAAGRVPLPGLDDADRRGPVKVRSRGTEALSLDREEIDVSDVAGIVDPGQAEAIARALRALLERRFDGESTLTECLEDLDALLDDEGLDALGGRTERPAFLTRPRAVDVAAAVNRYRSLELAESGEDDDVAETKTV